MDDRGTTLSHIYGFASVVPGLISVFYLINTDASWREYALVGSGWAAAIFFAGLLYFAFRRARTDGEEIGRLREQVEVAKKEVQARNATADYLAGLLIGRSATPRAPSSPVDNGSDLP